MNIKGLSARLGRLEQVVSPPRKGWFDPGYLDLIECMPVASDPEQRGVGVYFNADRTVAKYLYVGPEPDPAVMADLVRLRNTYCLTIIT